MTRDASGTLRILSADDAGQYSEWLALWARSPEQDPFAHPAYVAGDASVRHARALALHWTGESGEVLYPVLLADVQALPCWEPQFGPATDLSTPYGYGGPIFWGIQPDAMSGAFWRAVDQWAADHAVVSEFVRFRLGDPFRGSYPGDVQQRSQNVVRTLDVEPSRLWREYEHKVRKNVQKAQRSGLHVTVDTDGTHLDDFLRIYHGTMERRAAAESYHFGADYFRNIAGALRGSYAFFHVWHGDTIVSTELVLAGRTRLYSFLGGTVADAFHLRPNDLLKHEVITWGAQTGRGEFVLGGGLTPDDGIFRYKLAFAPHGVVPFFTGSRVLRPQVYDAMVRRAQLVGAVPQDRAGFFPAYR
jgi:hypothetical protein